MAKIDEWMLQKMVGENHLLESLTEKGVVSFGASLFSLYLCRLITIKQQ